MKKTLLTTPKLFLGEVITAWFSALSQRLVMVDSPVCQSHSSHPFFSAWGRSSSPALPALWKRQSPQQAYDCFCGPCTVLCQTAANFAPAQL